MTNRIALKVRGLPSIPIDDAIERFGKYYPKPVEQEEIFHISPSFIGAINPQGLTNWAQGAVTFKNEE